LVWVNRSNPDSLQSMFTDERRDIPLTRQATNGKDGKQARRADTATVRAT